jgi:hypothetical protein
LPSTHTPKSGVADVLRISKSSTNLSITLLGVVAILGFSPIYLKAGYAFGFSFSSGDHWRDKAEYERMRSRGSFTGSTLVLVGALHTITNIRPDENENPKAERAYFL